MQKLSDKYRIDEHQRDHQAQVVQTTLLVFDLLAKNYRLTEGERLLLECSALLHDIGHFISVEQHDRHSRYLILHDEALFHLPTELRFLLALIAGGHRKTPHDDLKKFSKEKQQRILQIMSLLRFADALDYTRETNELVERITLKRGKLMLILRAEISEEFKIRLLKRSRLIKKTFGLKPTIKQSVPNVRQR